MKTPPFDVSKGSDPGTKSFTDEPETQTDFYKDGEITPKNFEKKDTPGEAQGEKPPVTQLLGKMGEFEVNVTPVNNFNKDPAEAKAKLKDINMDATRDKMTFLYGKQLGLLSGGIFSLKQFLIKKTRCFFNRWLCGQYHTE